MRATVSDKGPMLLANLLELKETQTGILLATFTFGDDEGLLLLDMKDLCSILAWVADNSKSLQSTYCNLRANSVAAIQRKLLMLVHQGAEQFFGEPQIALPDLM